MRQLDCCVKSSTLGRDHVAVTVVSFAKRRKQRRNERLGLARTFHLRHDNGGLGTAENVASVLVTVKHLLANAPNRAVQQNRMPRHSRARRRTGLINDTVLPAVFITYTARSTVRRTCHATKGNLDRCWSELADNRPKKRGERYWKTLRRLHDYTIWARYAPRSSVI